MSSDHRVQSLPWAVFCVSRSIQRRTISQRVFVVHSQCLGIRASLFSANSIACVYLKKSPILNHIKHPYGLRKNTVMWRVFLFFPGSLSETLSWGESRMTPVHPIRMCMYRLFAGVHWSNPTQHLLRASHPSFKKHGKTPNPNKHWTHQDQNQRKFSVVNIHREHFIVCQDLSRISLTTALVVETRAKDWSSKPMIRALLRGSRSTDNEVMVADGSLEGCLALPLAPPGTLDWSGCSCRPNVSVYFNNREPTMVPPAM